MLPSHTRRKSPRTNQYLKDELTNLNTKLDKLIELVAIRQEINQLVTDMRLELSKRELQIQRLKEKLI